MRRIERHKSSWWLNPELPTQRTRVPSHLRDVDPATSDYMVGYATKHHTASFAPSRRWIPYNRLHSIDVGYVVEVYTLHDIATRYGLSDAGARYYKKNILPEPYGIVRRRSVSAHHWSRFVLMVMDIVMKDLEAKSQLRFLSRFYDHVGLIHKGVDYLERFYEREAQDDNIKTTDRFGVQWHD